MLQMEYVFPISIEDMSDAAYRRECEEEDVGNEIESKGDTSGWENEDREEDE